MIFCVQPEKAAPVSEVTLSGRVRVSSDVQLKNASSAIFFRPSGSVTEVSFVCSAKASAAIYVTGLPSSVAGTVSAVSLPV